MTDTQPSERSRADKNLLFGILAVQAGFISRDQLTDAIKAWAGDKSQLMGDVLVEQGALSDAEHAQLVPLVEKHIENHDGDPAKSLATLHDSGVDVDSLCTLGDEQVDATLSLIGQTKGGSAVEEATLSLVGQGDGGTEVDETIATTGGIDQSADQIRQQAMAGQRFRIVRPHARGGLGEVSVAKDLELNRDVALKEIQSRYANDESSRSRFLLEAEVTGGLEHPGIVPVYGLGNYDDGRPFYAMRFIQGDSLQEAVDQLHRGSGDPSPDFGGVAFRKLLGRFVDVCHAIEYAHSRGVLHRDLKPGNIMLGKYGETLVVDWGLAKMQGGETEPSSGTEQPLQPISASGSAATMMGSAIGTPAFMPPEQASGDLDKLGAASDVYSLGATLFYMLTGKTPFQGDPRAVLVDVLAGKFRSPREVCQTVPKPLDAICLKAMSRDPANRYASPESLADDVERFLADEPIGVIREPLSTRLRRWARKHQTLVASSAAVVLVSIVGLATFSSIVSGKNAALTDLNSTLDSRNSELSQLNNTLDRRNEELDSTNADLIAANDRANSAATAARASERRERKERDRAENALYLSDIRLASSYIQNQEHADAYDELLGHVPALSNGDRRGWEWYYLLTRSHLSLANWTAAPTNVDGIDWSPDGSRLATSHWGGGMDAVIWDAETGKQIQGISGATTLQRCMHWHPTENKIAWGAAVDDAVVRILDVATGKLTKLAENVGSITSVRWSPDGQRIAVGAMRIDGMQNGLSLVVWENKDGEWSVLNKMPTDGNGVDSVAWSPDGKELFVVGRRSPTWIMDPETFEKKRKSPLDSIDCAAWHPSEPKIACGRAYGKVWILNSETLKVEKSVVGHIGTVTAVAWSPDGKFLASGATDHAVRVWKTDVMESVGRFVGHTATVNAVCWHPDSSRLASCGEDGLVYVWPRSQKNAPLVLSKIDKSAGARIDRLPLFTWLDSKTIRTSSSGEKTKDIDVVTGKVRKSIPAPGGKWVRLSKNVVATRPASFDGIEAVFNPQAENTKRYRFESAGSMWINQAEDRIAVTGANTSFVRVRNLTNDDEFTLGEEALLSITDIVWSPDNQRVITVGSGRPSDGGNLSYAGWIHLFDNETGEFLNRSRLGGNRIRGTAGAWSPDAMRFMAGSQDGTCQLYDVPGLTTLFSKPIHRLRVNGLSWHPTQPRIASISGDLTLAIWDARNGEVYLRFDLPKLPMHVAWSPDGGRVAVLDAARKIHVWEATSGKQLAESDQLTQDLQGKFSRQLFTSLVAKDLPTAWLAGKNLLKVDGTFRWIDQYYLALAAIQQEDWETYRRCVDDLINKHDVTGDSEKTYLSLWTAALAADAVDDYESLIQAMTKVMESDSADRRFHVCLAGLLMRAGKIEEAKRRLDSAPAAVEDPSASSAYFHFFMAMCEHHLGNPSEAQRQLEIAEKISEQDLSKGAKMDRQTVLSILSKEARELIESNE